VGRLEDTSNYLQEGALSRAILSDNAKRLAWEDLESDIAESRKIPMALYAIQTSEFLKARACGRVYGIVLGDSAKLNDRRNH